MGSNQGWILTSLAILTLTIVSATSQSTDPQDPACGKTLGYHDTSIEAPGGSFADPNRTCIWTFDQSDPPLKGQNIFFTFNSLVIADGDSLTVKGKGYFKIFNKTSDQFVVMVDMSAVITYITGKSANVLRGFYAGMKVDACGPIVNDKGAVGVIKHPFFLSQSPKLVNCTWKFSTSDISFSKFNLNASSDFVRLKATSKTEFVGNYSGSVLPPDFVGENVAVSLLSKTTDHKADFELSFIPVTKSCSEFKIITESTTISPPKPLFAVDHQECVTILVGKVKASLVTDFKDAHDSIIINSGGGRYSPNIRSITKQSPNTVNYLLSEDTSMWIEFSSEQLIPFSSYTLTVEPLDVQGGLLHNNGTFSVKPTKDGKEVPVGLVVPESQQVFMTLNYSISSGDSITIYDDLIGDKVLLKLNQTGSGSLPIFGNSNELLVVANLKASNSSINAAFTGKVTAPGCHLYSTESSGVQKLNATTEQCQWLIKPDTSQSHDNLDVTILPSKFEAEITVYEGISQNKRKLINVVGSQIPKTGLRLYILANVGATIEYHSSTTSAAALPFTVAYNTIPSCIKNIMLTSSELEITSPNFPDLYPLNGDCSWNIQVPKGKLTHLIFNNLSLPFENFVSINDSTGFNRKFNGFDLPDDLILNGSVTLNWHSTLDRIRASGFRIKLRSIDCGGNFLSDGSFLTPSISQLQQQSCVWSVILPEDSKNVPYINFSFAKNQILNKTSETLTFYDGGSVRDPIISQGRNHLTTRSSKLLITYDLPLKSKGSVYNITFSKQDCTESRCTSAPYCMQNDWICNGKNECGDFSDEAYCAPKPTDCGFPKEINETTTIDSNLIKQTRKSLNCSGTIQAPTFSSMLITIEKIDLVNENDILKIEDPDAQETLHVASYLVQAQDDFVVTTNNSVTINFFSSHLSDKDSSFSLKIQPQDNGRRINIPKHQPLSLVAKESEETYVLTAKDQVLVKLNQTVVDHLNGSEISFYDGITKNKLLASFNENSNIYPVFSTSTEMLIVVNSTQNLTLEADVESVTGCYEIQTDRTGYFFTKDLLPDEPCTWLVKRPQDSEIGTLILNVETLTDSSVTIFNHLDDNSTLITLDSSSLLPYTLHVPYVDGVRMEVKRHIRNESTAGLGVAKINYEVIPKCNTVYNLTSNVTITSSGYPHLYPYNADCRWTFNIPEDKLVHIQFIDMDLHRDHKVEVGYKNKTYQKYSGQILPDDIVIFNQSSAFMTWRSNGNTSNIGRGFKVLVEIIDCGGVYGSGKGDIHSPKFVNETTYCVWLIDIPEKDTQTKYTNIVQYNIKTQITEKNLEIHDGGRMTNTSLPIESNKEELSRTNKLVIKYLYEYHNGTTAPLLDFSYSSHGCNETCHNGICLKPIWKCNGINECEDFTDEFNCTQHAPTPAPSPGGGGVSTGWFVGGLFIALACGIIGTIVIPKLIAKYRPSNRHSRLINESES